MDLIWDIVKKFVRNDSMSIALFGLFLVCAIGQSVTGWFAFNESLRKGLFTEMAFADYLRTGNFLDGIFSNWQAAILQLAVLITFGTVLRQKGSVHSLKTKGPNHRRLNWKLGLRPTMRQWLYANSLSLAFIGMFLVTFMLHLLFGEWKYNEDQGLRHLPAISLGSYAASSNFWFSVFQCWEAEFWAIGIYMVLSIFLRQENSPESKPVEASNEETGEANE